MLDNKQITLIQNKLYKHCGIYLNDSKFTMIKNRVYHLMRETQISDLNLLLHTLDSNPKVRQAFINSFTTNKTDFFREYPHFQDMIDRSLPMLFKANKPIKIYCCASSTGQEPYSIAMSVLRAKQLYGANTPTSIIATDIDTDVLQEAKEGIYTVNFKIEKFPSWFESTEYFDILGEGKTTSVKLLKAKDKLKSMIHFKQFNLFDRHYPFKKEEFDIIFCRNVLIYFKQPDQQNILTRLIETLRFGGTFYLGHSESLFHLSEKFKKLGNKTFLKTKA